MNGLDEILECFEAALELERELGVRVVPIDRSLLAPPRPSRPSRPASSVVRESREGRERPEVRAEGEARPLRNEHERNERESRGGYDFVFLHDRPLSEKGLEMMSKIVAAMGKTLETAPVVIEQPPPPARAYVALGFYALQKFFPGLKGEPGMWLGAGGGKNVLVTYSPAFFERFAVVTDAVEIKKREMWRSLKGLMQRLRGEVK